MAVGENFTSSWSELYPSEAHVDNPKHVSVDVTIEIPAEFADEVRKVITEKRMLRVWYLPALTDGRQIAEDVQAL